MNIRIELNNVKPYIPGVPVEEVKRSYGLNQIYKLASNEIPFAPLYLNKVLKKELASINRYPESGCFYLRKALAKKLKVSGNQLVFGNGSDEIITLSVRAFVGKGDEVVVAYPTFLIYEIQSEIQGASIVKVPLKNMSYDLDKIAEKVTKKTKIVFIANPDNPTGSYIRRDAFDEFINNIPRGVLVFCDEAYFEFAPGDFPRTIELLKKRENLIVTRTFSKAYGLAGLRIGYAITTEEIAGYLNKVREPFNVNRFSQSLALEALENKDFLKKVVGYVNKEKKFLYAKLGRLKLCFFDSATNFILVDFKTDATGLYNYLLRRGVIIRAMKGWGLPNFFRVTLGLRKENQKFISLLSDYLRTYKNLK
ncbi:MAG: histidinol-phosphate transaminase [Candidatus Omnitrophota bacterium]